MLIIPLVLTVSALSVIAFIIWLRYHRRAQSDLTVSFSVSPNLKTLKMYFFISVRISDGNQNILKLETKTTEHKHENVGKMASGYIKYI